MFVGLFLLQHLFALEAYQDLIKAVMEAAAAFVGIAIKQRKEPITYEQFQQHRMGKYR
jgi:DnaJ family protein C protein 13